MNVDPRRSGTETGTETDHEIRASGKATCVNAQIVATVYTFVIVDSLASETVGTGGINWCAATNWRGSVPKTLTTDLHTSLRMPFEPGLATGGASFSQYTDGYADFQKYMQGHGSSGDDFSKNYQQYIQQHGSQGGGGYQKYMDFQKYSDQGGERSANCKQQNSTSRFNAKERRKP